jgi:NADH-quinone oxidoreductase subunit C
MPAPAPAAEDLLYLEERFSQAITGRTEHLGQVSLYVDAQYLVEVCRFLRDDPRFQFDLLSDLTGLDHGIDAEPRFEVNYHLYSIPQRRRLRLKVQPPGPEPAVPSVTGVWRTADWHERETFDMYGIVFEGHPDLRRILMPEEFQWHPLRKDFPVRGYDDF